MSPFPENLTGLFDSLRAFIFELGDDVEEKRLKLYVAFKKIKNFACAVPVKGKGLLWLYLKLDHEGGPLSRKGSSLMRPARGIGEPGMWRFSYAPKLTWKR